VRANRYSDYKRDCGEPGAAPEPSASIEYRVAADLSSALSRTDGRMDAPVTPHHRRRRVPFWSTRSEETAAVSLGCHRTGWHYRDLDLSSWKLPLARARPMEGLAPKARRDDHDSGQTGELRHGKWLLWF